MEQLFNTLSANKRLWVMERKPKTCIQAGELVDEYEEEQRYNPVDGKGTQADRRCPRVEKQDILRTPVTIDPQKRRQPDEIQ